MSRIWLRRILAWLLPLLLVGQIAAQDDIAGSVRRLIRQLESRELAQREAAEQLLLDLGPAALEYLPELNDRVPAETRQRLGRVRLRLERERATAQSEPTRVTLTGRLPLSAILTSLQEQTGNEIIDHRRQFGQAPHDPKLDVDLQNEAFWPALDQVLDLAELTVYPYARQTGLALVSRSTEMPPRRGLATYTGAFRVQPLEIIAQRDLAIATQRSLRLRLEVAWEPRLRPIALMYSLNDIYAVADDGQDLSPRAAPTELEASLTPGAQSTSLDVVLQPAPRSAQRIAQFGGRLRVLMPGRTETFRFDNLQQAAGVEQQRSGTIVRLERVRRNNELWELRIRVALEDPKQALESHRDWMYHNEARLEAPDGQVLPPDGFEVTLQTDTAFGMAYLFDLADDLAGYAFVYDTPGVMLSQPIEFELRDLDLP